MDIPGMPKPGPEHHRLAALAGTWEGDDVIHPSPWDPKGARARTTMNGRMALGGLYLITDWQQVKDGQVSFLGHGVYGWDPRGKCFTLHWFDNTGVEHGAPFFGSWDDGALTLDHEMAQFGRSRHVYELKDGTLGLLLQMSPDGKAWNTFLEGSYRRTG
jgi:hypothetical protein